MYTVTNYLTNHSLMKILNFAHCSHTWRYYYGTAGKTEATPTELNSREYTSNIVKSCWGSISVKKIFWNGFFGFLYLWAPKLYILTQYGSYVSDDTGSKISEYSGSPVPGPVSPPQTSHWPVWDRKVICTTKGHMQWHPEASVQTHIW